MSVTHYRDPNQYIQKTWLSSGKGRKLSKSGFMTGMIKAAYSYQKYMHRAFGLDSEPGVSGLFYPCGLELNTEFRSLPMYIFDLTTMSQIQGATTVSAHLAWRMVQDAVSGNMGMFPVGNIDLSGNFNSTSIYRPYISQGATVNQQKHMLEWIKVKLNLQGPTQKATKFTVSVIKPTPQFLAVQNRIQQALTPATPFQWTNADQNVWNVRANKLCVNSIASIPPITDQKKYFDVVMQKQYDIQPTSTTEGDPAGHTVTQELFLRVNKVLDFMYSGEQGSATSTLNGITDNGNVADLTILRPNAGIGGETTNVYPKPGTQLFLLVEAFCAQQEPLFNAQLHPSFDISIEKKISSLGYRAP